MKKMGTFKTSQKFANSVLFILMTMICSFVSTVRADYFNLAWGLQYGEASNDYGSYLVTDSNSNIYTVWTVQNGSSTTTYMRKFDPSGNIIWTKSESRNYLDYPVHIGIDSQNNYCIFGYADGPSGGTYYGGRDGFVRKYNSDGQLLWSRQQGTSGYDSTTWGTIDNQGNVYTVGTYDNLGVAITKYNQYGGCVWQKLYKIYDDGQSGMIIISPTGELYLTLAFGWSTGESNNQKAFLKLDQNGNLLWCREFGVVNIPDGGVCLAGFDTQERMVFQIETKGALGGAHLGGYDIALGRCDSDGNIEWLGQYGTPSDDYCYQSLVGPADSTIAVGFTTGSFFGTNQGGNDAYIMQISSDGILLGGSQFGTASSDVLHTLFSYRSNYYVSGSTSGSLWGTNLGEQDIISGQLNLDPTNDEKADAIAIQAGGIINGWTIGATGTDITRNGYNDCNDVWYYFEPAAKDKYTITLYNSSFDTTLGVFDENDKEVEFNDDFFGEKSVVILKAKAGKRYYIRVAGYDGETGDFTLSVQQGAVQAIQGDLNYDGNVNLADLSSLAQNWMMGG